MIFNRGANNIRSNYYKPSNSTSASDASSNNNIMGNDNSNLNTNTSSSPNNYDNVRARDKSDYLQGSGMGIRNSRVSVSPSRRNSTHRSNNDNGRNDMHLSPNNTSSANNKFASLSTSASSLSSPRRSPQTHQMSEMVVVPSLPVGLNGPTQFEFLDDCDELAEDGGKQQYLTFLSSHSSSIYQHHNNASITGSPVRTMGGGGLPGQNEKRLCVMDLKPFYDNMDVIMDNQMGEEFSIEKDTKMFSYSDDEYDCNEYDNYNDEQKEIITKPIHDPNQVMDKHVHHLLNTSLPLNRPNDHHHQIIKNDNYISPLSPTSPGSPLNRSYFNSPKTSTDERSNCVVKNILDGEGVMSLEEKLRRERQRLHSHGITQFCWTAFNSNSFSTVNHHHKSPRLSPRRSYSPSRPNSVQRENIIRILVPLRGNIYIQDGVGPTATSPLRLLYDKSMLQDYIANAQMLQMKNRKQKKYKKQKKYLIKSAIGRDASAIDPQLSPDGSMVAFVVAGEIYVMSCGDPYVHNIYDNDGHSHDVNNNSLDGRNDYESNIQYDDMPIDHQNGCISSISAPTRVTFGAFISDSIEDHEIGEGASSEEDEEDSFDIRPSAKKRYGRCITHGLADFIAQEEMDRYRGFWWDTESKGILFVRVDESYVPPYRITHQGKDGMAGDESDFEDHRYPFAGENNPEISLGYIPIDRELILLLDQYGKRGGKNEDSLHPSSSEDSNISTGRSRAEVNWLRVKWFSPPTEASEYLARINWLPCGSVCAQWQDRRQSKLVLVKVDINTGESIILHQEQSNVWINLHHMFKVLPKPIHPNECLHELKNNRIQYCVPDGSFSFLFASERTGYCHLYLYTYMPGDCSAICLRAVTAGEWIVESIVGVDMENDLVYVTGTYDSPLERHLYTLPLRRNKSSPKSDVGIGVSGRRLRNVMKNLGSSSRAEYNFSSQIYPPAVNNEIPADPIRITAEAGMHSIVMDKSCRFFVDTSSDLSRPPSSKVYAISKHQIGETSLIFVLYDSSLDLKDDKEIHAPELMSLRTSDGKETLHIALYIPDKSAYGPGPFPLICAVYGGPHVQRVNRCWSQCVDMRAQRLRSMGFAVVKCDNRGSSRRGLEFEGAIKQNLGRIEVLDQVEAVRYLIKKQIADPKRVGIYGWSYGGYLAAMCLCRAPDIFHVAIAGAPVTSWDGYDTHYTERYMGLPSENTSGYHESAIFQHIHNMRGKLMIIHGLIDENVHFRHTARLINRLIAGSKDYDLLIFPDERHSPRRIRDRIYMEKRMTDYFVRNLLEKSRNENEELMFMGHL